MIRHREGNEFWLIAQNDHALAAGLLAAHVGNATFASPSPYLQTVDAIALHDAGWLAHDANPTLDAEGLPLHVFETPPRPATSIWAESVERAAARDPYSGLLVSLHVLRLATLSFARLQKAQLSAHELFELNRFQHAQIELQAILRQKLELLTSGPLTLGLGRRGIADDEDVLIFNAGLLRLLDVISLDACGVDPTIEVVDSICPHPGAAPCSFTLRRESVHQMKVEPWPFDVPSIDLQIPFRRVPAQSYRSVTAFREIWSAAANERLNIKVSSTPPA